MNSTMFLENIGAIKLCVDFSFFSIKPRQIVQNSLRGKRKGK